MSKFSKCLRGAAAVGLAVAGLIVIAGPSQAATGDVITFAGTSSGVGSVDGTGAAASFFSPQGIANDSLGNLYVADTGNNKIRKISPGGVVTTFAGSGLNVDTAGTGIGAAFRSPRGIAIDIADNLYVTTSDKIRKITPSGVVTTLAGSALSGKVDGTGAAASFDGPIGIAVNAAGYLYVADTSNNLIRQVSPLGVVETLAGSGVLGFADGTGALASFAEPFDVALDSAGNVYVADTSNSRVRKVTPFGVVTTLAGSGVSAVTDGIGINAAFDSPVGLTIDTAGNLFVADVGAYNIRVITPGGVVTTLAGGPNPLHLDVDGNGLAALFVRPYGITIANSGFLYITEQGQHDAKSPGAKTAGANVIRRIDINGLIPGVAGSTTTTLAATTTTTIATNGGCPLSVVCATSTTTTSTLPCASASTTIDVTGVQRCLPSVTTTTVERSVTTVPLVFPTVPVPTVTVPPTVLTFTPIPTTPVPTTVAPPLPTLTVAALVAQSSIPVAPVPGPSVEGQVADITPAYTGSSNTGTVAVAMVLLASGTLLLAGRSMRSTTRKSLSGRK
jgi:serine/threonine protein kinase, bacterial